MDPARAWDCWARAWDRAWDRDRCSAVGARLGPHLVALHVALSGPTRPPATDGAVRWEQREWREASCFSATALVRLSGSGLLDLGPLRTRPSHRAVLLYNLVALACMAAAEMQGNQDEAARHCVERRGGDACNSRHLYLRLSRAPSLCFLRFANGALYGSAAYVRPTGALSLTRSPRRGSGRNGPHHLDA